MQYDRSTFASESLAPPQIGSFQELAAQSGALTTRPAAATPPTPPPSRARARVSDARPKTAVSQCRASERARLIAHQRRQGGAQTQPIPILLLK